VADGDSKRCERRPAYVVRSLRVSFMQSTSQLTMSEGCRRWEFLVQVSSFLSRRPRRYDSTALISREESMPYTFLLLNAICYVLTTLFSSGKRCRSVHRLEC